MNCPYCGEEMERGVIQSNYELNWKHKKHFLKSAEYHDGAVVLSERAPPKGSAAAAFLCRKCEKVIIDYKDGSCDLNRR